MRRRAIALTLLALIGAALLFWIAAGRYLRTEDISSLRSPEAAPTLLPVPSDWSIRPMFPEAELALYPYSPAAYPQFEEALPGRLCATWENGGLFWRFWGDVSFAVPTAVVTEQPGLAAQMTGLFTGWGVGANTPDFRFCGIPAPYPEKPSEAN